MQTGWQKHSLIVLFLSASFLILWASVSSAKMTKAPSWDGVEWINLSQGKDSLDIDDLREQVVYLSFFQKW